jgi:hypothetical protein
VVKSLQAAKLGDDVDTTAALCGQTVDVFMEKQEFL